MRSRDALGSDAHLLRPIEETGRGFYVAVGFLLAGVAAGAAAYWFQLTRGLGVTGLNQPVSWGFYVTNFVFFIGISHAGTLISAILRMSQAEWRRPITRMAEVITVMVLFIGAGNILLDLGRPDRALNVLLYGRYQSPLLWDATSISAYLTASVFYLYLPLIPDIAILRDHSSKYRLFYTVLALGWAGTEGQIRILNRAVAIMAVLVIPIAVSVHTVVSFVFSMTLQPGWHSTIFGPYFVVGAIFSGIAALIIFMVVFRRVYRLENYLRHVHFNYLGLLLMTMSFLWFYFTFAEYITGFYGNEPEEMKVFWVKFTGNYAFFFWAMVACNFVVPMILLGIRRFRTILGILVASIFVSVGMWLERFIIIIPTLSHPRLPLDTVGYMPTLVEWGLMVGCFSLFSLFYLLFTKIFPIISIWEIREGREAGLREVEERIRSYLPEEGEPVAARRLIAEGIENE
ncbi:MAG: polysulfide reductase NrfD [Candidatus Tectomicrobia bacterium]|uniref:Polysulfide reductase NrfD n=1 Tax=Tectimicrobiota bacterium TaxID=2528274 RepID=A0A932HY33_UNCTE|nr:polysulfide reductase NrfD [Candidatus Tectomicrobia bacterium]